MIVLVFVLFLFRGGVPLMHHCAWPLGCWCCRGIHRAPTDNKLQQQQPPPPQEVEACFDRLCLYDVSQECADFEARMRKQRHHKKHKHHYLHE